MNLAEQMRLDNDYKYHEPKEGQRERFTKIREVAKELAKTIMELCPDTRERSTALTQLDLTVMMANASIARKES